MMGPALHKTAQFHIVEEEFCTVPAPRLAPRPQRGPARRRRWLHELAHPCRARKFFMSLSHDGRASLFLGVRLLQVAGFLRLDTKIDCGTPQAPPAAATAVRLCAPPARAGASGRCVRWRAAAESHAPVRDVRPSRTED